MASLLSSVRYMGRALPSRGVGYSSWIRPKLLDLAVSGNTSSSSSRVISGLNRPKYTVSYVQGADFARDKPFPLLGATLGQALDTTTERCPDQEFVVFLEGGQRLTFSQFRDEVDRLAAGLLVLGVGRGDHVGIWGPNTLEWVLTQYATARIGGVLVNLNPAYQTGDIEFALKKVGVKALVAARPFKTQNYYEMVAEVCPELELATPGHLESKRLPELESLIVMGNDQHPGAFSFDDVMNMGGAPQRDIIDGCKKTLQFDDIANIQFTSGTTGVPKATCVTHFHLLNNMNILLDAYPEDTPKTKCIPTPLFHAFGMMATLLALISGAKAVFPSAGFDARACLQAIQDERCQIWYGIPTMLIDMLNHPDFSTFDLSAFELANSGGSHVPAEIARELGASIPSLQNISIMFGMTEMCGILTCTQADDPEVKRYTTIGRPCTYCEIKITDPETGDIVPVGTPGELCGRSPSIMTGYWDDQEKTRETLDSRRWLHSGDLATMDEDGYVSIVGRIKDVVIRGGENIFPVHIEQHLHTHPQIEDVHVIGVPDKRMIEELCACVKLKPGQTATEDEIRDFCRGKLAHYEVPRYVKFVPAFPVTPSNKVQKFKLREQIVKELNLEGISTSQN